VKVTFAKGASLSDADAMFNASLDAGTRHVIDIHGGNELNEGTFVSRVREAVALNHA
jgi:hypothetical protein